MNEICFNGYFTQMLEKVSVTAHKICANFMIYIIYIIFRVLITENKIKFVREPLNWIIWSYTNDKIFVQNDNRYTTTVKQCQCFVQRFTAVGT